jgi:hypothetical protein
MEMARRNKRANKDEEQTIKRPRGLEEAWSSSPTRNPRYVLYCTNHESGRQYVVNSYGLYAIRKIFDAIVGENEVEPSHLDPDRTMTFGDIDIRSEQMQAILDHQYSKAEEEWELQAPYPEQIDNFLHGGPMSKELEHRDPSGNVVKPERKVREPKPVKERIDRSAFITVQQLAEEAGIDPRDARAALRKAKVEKPAGGWLGDETWAKEIRVILKAAAKELKKKGGK